MPIDIVVVGPGLIGRQHISLIRSNPETRLVAVVGPDSSENRAVAAVEDVLLFPSLDSCFKAVIADAVILSSPNAFHFEQARWCIERNIPVLIEKPVTVSLNEARLLIELVERHQAKALVGHHRAYSPLLLHAQNVVNSGCLGRLVSFVGSAQFYKPSQYFRDGLWRKQVGGGPILINLIHEIGNMRALMGEIIEVQALASSAVRRFEVEDTVVINLRFGNGALGVFVLSDTAASPMSWEQTAKENPAYPSYEDVDCYNLTGTCGCLSFPTMRLRYISEGAEASWWKPMLEDKFNVNHEDPLCCQLIHFIELVNGRTKAKVSVIDGYRNLLVIDAIQNAIVSGQTEKVAY